MRTLCAVLALLIAGVASGQNTVRLRPWASVAGAVKLSDAAVIDGPDAAQLGAVVIAESVDALGERASVDVARVRGVLKKADGINLGRVSLSGSACEVRAARAAPPRRENEAFETTKRGADGETNRDRVAAAIAQSLDAALADLRLSYEPSDADVLGASTAGLTVAAQTAGSGDRVPVLLRVYRGDQLLRSATVRVGVLVRRRVALAKETISRGSTVRADNLTLAEQWLPATVSPATPTAAIGAEARGPIRAGEVVTAEQVNPPIVVRTGDTVSVDCLSGTIVLRSQARAVENGREGQTIRFQTPGSDREFRARVSGPAHAVVVAPPSGPGADPAGRKGTPGGRS